MQLSQKEKTCSQFVSAFLKSMLNFEHFQKEMSLIARLFPKFATPKDLVKPISEKSTFRGPSDMQHGKDDRTYLKSESHHLYFIY